MLSKTYFSPGHNEVVEVSQTQRKEKGYGNKRERVKKKKWPFNYALNRGGDLHNQESERKVFHTEPQELFNTSCEYHHRVLWLAV